MNVEPPQRDQRARDGRKRRRALWFAGAGVVAGLATGITSAFGGISMRQTIMLGLPAAVLTFGGLAVAVAPDPETADREGFRAGLKAGLLRRRWRSVFGRQDRDRP
jgi:hypothetical protein